MSIKSFKPTTPSRRHMTVSGFDGVDKKAKPEPSLTEVLKKNAGRNSYGRITVRHRGGGSKRKYRIIDFKRDKTDMTATVLRLEYDPNRSANIALLVYADGEKRYILAPLGLQKGDTVISGEGADIKAGNALPLSAIPVGTMVHNIEFQPGRGGQGQLLVAAPRPRPGEVHHRLAPRQESQPPPLPCVGAQDSGQKPPRLPGLAVQPVGEQDGLIAQLPAPLCRRPAQLPILSRNTPARMKLI